MMFQPKPIRVSRAPAPESTASLRGPAAARGASTRAQAIPKNTPRTTQVIAPPTIVRT